MHQCAHCKRMAAEKAALRDLIDDLSPTFPPVFGLSATRRDMLAYLLRHHDAHYSGLMHAARIATLDTMKVHMVYVRKWLAACTDLTVRCSWGTHYTVEPRAKARGLFARLMKQDEELLEGFRARILADPALHDCLTKTKRKTLEPAL